LLAGRVSPTYHPDMAVDLEACRQLAGRLAEPGADAAVAAAAREAVEALVVEVERLRAAMSRAADACEEGAAARVPAMLRAALGPAAVDEFCVRCGEPVERTPGALMAHRRVCAARVR
jgi:hypothetical protein